MDYQVEGVNNILIIMKLKVVPIDLVLMQAYMYLQPIMKI